MVSIATVNIRLKEYNEALENRKQLEEESKRSEIEWLMVGLGPFLLATSLGFRIAKVTFDYLDNTPSPWLPANKSPTQGH